MLSFAEAICLLGLGTRKEKAYDPNEILFGYSLVGAILCELSFMGKIDIDLEHLIVIDKTPTKNKILDSVLNDLPESETRKPVSFWLRVLLRNADEVIDLVFSDLVNKSILKRVDEKSRWGFYKKNYSIINNKEVNAIVSRIKELILNKEEIPDPREAAFIGLIYACNLLELILPSKELKQSEKRIETLAKLDMIGREVVVIMTEIKNLFFASQKNPFISFIKSIIFAIKSEHELFLLKKDKNYLGILLALGGFLFYAFYTVMFQIASEQHNMLQNITTFCIGLVIFHFFMAICYLPICLSLGKEFFKCHNPKLVILRCAFSIISFIFYTLARVWTETVDNSMLESTDGLWIILILTVLHVKIGKIAKLGAIIGTVGMVFIYFFDIGSTRNLIGGIFGTLSGLTLAIVLFITSYIVKRDPPLRIGFYHSLVGLTLSIVFSIIFGATTGWTMPNIYCIVIMMLAGFFFAIILFYWIEAFYYTEVYIIGATSFALPIFAESINWVLTQTIVPWSTVIGTLILTIGGGLIIIFSFLKDRKEQKQYSLEKQFNKKI